MEYLFENIKNLWVIIFFAVIFITFLLFVWFFIKLLRGKEISFDDWRGDLREGITHINSYEVINQMQNDCLIENSEELKISITIEKLTKRLLLFVIIMFLISVGLLPVAIKYFNFFIIPGIKNAIIIFYELYALMLGFFTAAFFLGYYSYHGLKPPQSEKVFINSVGGEYLNNLKNAFFELATNTRIQLILNEKRKAFYLRSKFFAVFGFIFFIAIIAIFFLSKN